MNRDICYNWEEKKFNLKEIIIILDSSQISMLVIFIILIGLSAFYSSTETAFMSVSKIRIKTRAEDDSDPKQARAQIVNELLQDSDKL